MPPGAPAPGPPPPGQAPSQVRGLPPGYVPPAAVYGPPVHKPGAVALRPLALGDFFDGAFKTIRGNPAAMVGLAALVTTVFMVLPTVLTLLLAAAGHLTFDLRPSPATGELYWARRGQGAWLAGLPLRVSAVGRLRDAMVTHSSLNLLRSLDGGRLWDGFVRLVDRTDRQRGFGDYFGYTFVLRGQAEIMLEADVKPWDIAPFKILFEEAGGRFTDLAGRPTIYSGNALATNGRLHDEVLALLSATPG